MALKKVEPKDSQSQENKENVSNFEFKEGQKNTEPEVQEKPVEKMYSESDVKDLFNQLSNKFEKKLNEEVSKIREKSERSVSGTKEQENTDDLISDYLDDDNEVIFFSYSTRFSIHSDVRMGVESIPPHGAVEFRHLFTEQKPTARGNSTVSISIARIRSKKQAEWMRKSPLMNVQFFERIDNTINNNGKDYASIAVSVTNEVNTFNDMKVIEKAKMYNIPMEQDVNNLRKNVINHMIKAKVNQLKTLQERMIQSFQNDEPREIELQ